MLCGIVHCVIKPLLSQLFLSVVVLEITTVVMLRYITHSLLSFLFVKFFLLPLQYEADAGSRNSTGVIVYSVPPKIVPPPGHYSLVNNVPPDIIH